MDLAPLEVVKLPEAKRGFVLLPRRWMVERDFGWMSRFRRLARDQERLADVLKGFHLIAFIMLMWNQVLPVLCVLSSPFQALESILDKQAPEAERGSSLASPKPPEIRAHTKRLAQERAANNQGRPKDHGIAQMAYRCRYGAFCHRSDSDSL